MIKINLLPVRTARKKEDVRRQVSTFLLLLGLCLAGMGYGVFIMNKEVSALKREIASTENEIKTYQARVKKVTEYKEALKKLESKMSIIAKLDSSRSAPVRLVDALTQVVIGDKMWLTSVKEADGKIDLAGIAIDENVVADFMRRLESTPYFATVDLGSTKQVIYDLRAGEHESSEKKRDAGIRKDADPKYRKFTEFTISCNLSLDALARGAAQHS